jgi:molecular chaperone DnaJ
VASQDWFNKDFYATLGVPKGADDATIKKAYRKLARKLHPDANPGDATSEAKFKDVGEAYAVLSDKEQRGQYDAIRAMGGGARFRPGGGEGAGFEDAFSGMFGRGARGGRSSGQQVPPGFEDLLGNLFGGGGFSMGPQPGGDLAAATEVTFRQAAEGAPIRLNVGGRPVNTRLPVGVRDGQKIRLRGKGQPSPNGGAAGDLVLTVHVSPHPVFTTDGSNLRVRVPVTFPEAALGTQIDVPTLDGTTVRVKVPAGTASGTTLRVKGRGLKAKSATGDLLATVEVQVPSKLSGRAKEVLASIDEDFPGGDLRADLYRRAAT